MTRNSTFSIHHLSDNKHRITRHKGLLLLRGLVLSRLNLAKWKLDSWLVWPEPNPPHVDGVGVSTAAVSMTWRRWWLMLRLWFKINPWMLRVQNVWSIVLWRKKKEDENTKTLTKATKILHPMHESDRLSFDHVSMASFVCCVREMPNSWSQ